MRDSNENYLIGIGGAKASGKDTLAQSLLQYDSDISIMGMSDILRDISIVLNPIIVFEPEFQWKLSGPWQGEVHRYREFLPLYEAIRKDYGEDAAYTELKRVPYFRSFLQRLGTEAGRYLISETVWVDVVRRRILRSLTKGPVVVTGIRYQNELDLIRELGGVAAYVQGNLTKHTDAHSSENSLSRADFDYEVDNFGTLKALVTIEAPALLAWVRRDFSRSKREEA